jgi:hypothetical protein
MGVRACVLVRAYAFIVVCVCCVCSCTRVCLSACVCVSVRVHAWEGLPHGLCMVPHGPNKMYERSHTLQGVWQHFPSARLGSANLGSTLLNLCIHMVWEQ